MRQPPRGKGVTSHRPKHPPVEAMRLDLRHAWLAATAGPTQASFDMPRKLLYFTNRLFNHKVQSMPQDPLTTTLSALADPTRRAILSRLVSGAASVTELTRPFDMTMPAVSKHLKVLQRAGLIARTREAQWRPCRLNAGPLKDVADWVEEYRQHWEKRLDRLDSYLTELQQHEMADKSTLSERQRVAGRPGAIETVRQTLNRLAHKIGRKK